MAENYMTPRSAEENEVLLGQRYGVAPTPGCQLQPPDIHGWTPTPPEVEAPKAVPNVVTVFGGTGMLGRSLLKKLSGKFEKIKVATRDPVKAQAAVSGVEGVEFVTACVTDYDQVQAACEGSGTVINLVGILFETSTDTFHKIQYVGAKNVASAARAVGAENMLHMSAIGAADASKSNYAKSKGWGEEAVKATMPNAVVFRPSVVFGPEDNFFNQFNNFPLPFLPLVGGGHTNFQPVYVEDVTDAMVKCADGKTGRGQTFELGGPDVFTFAELMSKCSTKPTVPVPFIVAEVQGWFMEWMMPVPMVTQDQVILLRKDNVVSEGAATLADLKIVPKSVDEIVPTYIK